MALTDITEGGECSANPYPDAIIVGTDEGLMLGKSLKKASPEGVHELSLETSESVRVMIDPRDWPNAAKWTATMIISLHAFISPLGSSIFSPAAKSAAKDLEVNGSFHQTLLVSIFIAALACGPLVFAPLSEIYGRAKITNLAAFLFIIFNVACSQSQTFAQLLIFRFLTGFAGSAPLAIGPAIIADVWRPHERNKANALYSLGPLVGPIIGPIIGGFMASSLSWRWVFYLMVILSTAALIIGIFFHKDTYVPPDSMEKSFHSVYTRMGRPLKLLFSDLGLFLASLIMALAYAYLFLLIFTFPIVFGRQYHETPEIIGLNYLGLGFGYLLSLITAIPSCDWAYNKMKRRHNGFDVPEFRLPVLCYCSPIMPIGILIYGWPSQYRTYWLFPIIGTAVLGFGTLVTFFCIQGYIIDCFLKHAASAVGAAVVLRSLFGFLMPLVGALLYDAIGIGWGNTVVAGTAFTVGVPLSIILFYRGSRIREKYGVILE